MRFRICLLATSIVVVNFFASVPVFADEIEEIESNTESLVSDGTLNGQASTVKKQQGLVENSFRYDDGEWIYEDYGISMLVEDEENEDADEKIKPWIYEDGYWRNESGEPIPAAMEKGIDVSWHQGEVDWEKVQATDVSFAIVRCGYGNDQEDQDDSRWKYNADECTRLGIPLGTYIYSYALDVEEAKSEAAHVLRLVEGYDLSFPIFYDLEDENYTGSLSAKEIGDIAETFVNEMNNAGYEVIIYASKYWFENVLTDSRFDQWEKWVAQYNDRCTYNGKYMMWQCASDGRIDGIDGNVDINFTIDPEKIEYIPETEPESKENTESESQTQEKPTPEPEPEPEIPTPIEDPVGDFVTRLYRLVLNREPEQTGWNAWKSQLINHVNTGSDVLQGFVFSDEFIKRNMSNEEYVEILYRTCLNREPDIAGKQAWVECLESGLSRRHVLQGFAESEEFTQICKDYEIVRGNIELTAKEDKYPQITQYLYRCYRVFLNREPDMDGLRSWIDAFVIRGEHPGKITEGFVMSKELTQKNLSNEAYVRLLYKGLFNREADQQGLNDWLRWLNSGKSRRDVFWGFAESNEFRELVESFGL